MSNFTQAKVYANSLGQSLNKCSLEQFFKDIQSKFYPKIKIDFMEYFLEIIDKDGEFVIPHIKLNEYGVVTSARSNHIKEKLDNLGMIEGDDFLLPDIRQQDLKHGGSNKKQYFLTPESFKKCLMRAKRHGQSIDPTMYCDYYILLEKIYKLYSIYQKSYDDKMLSMKDDKIDSLSKKIDEQSEQIRQLIGHTIEVKKEVVTAKEETIVVKEKLNIVEKVVKDTNEKITSVYGHICNFFSSGKAYAKDFVSTLFKSTYQTEVCAYLKDRNPKKIKIQYVFKAEVQELDDKERKANKVKVGDIRLFISCMNKENTKKTLDGITKKHKIVGRSVVGIYTNEINSEMRELSGFEKFDGNTKTIHFNAKNPFSQPIMYNIVRELRLACFKSYSCANALSEYFLDQNIAFAERMASRIDKIIGLYIGADGKVTKEHMRKYSDKINQLYRDLEDMSLDAPDNEEKLSELVDKVGLDHIKQCADEIFMLTNE